MIKRSGIGILGLILILAAWSNGGVAVACAICIPYPTRTDADFFVDGQVVALARENPAKPFTFRVVETLKGDTDDADIDLFLDSTTRRRLTANPSRAVVLARSSGGAWRSLGYADAEYENVVRQILEQSGCWSSHDSCKPSRLEFFAPLLGHDNSRLHNLAYLEIGRASYAEIRQFSHYWPADDIRVMLRNPAYLEWYPLAILMLAHNGDEDDRRYIEQRFLSSTRLGVSSNLSAWATALVEILREDGIAAIESHYFLTPGRDKEDLESVLRALSEHGTNGRTDLRPRIVKSYAALLDTYPDLAGPVATDLARWRRWELAPVLEEILRSDASDPLTTYAIRLYLARASSATGRGE